MDESFGAVIAAWGGFYSFLGTAAATLLGLLFVSVSLRLNIFQQKNVADVRDFALQTFASIFFLVLISLVFLIPGQNRAGLALPLVAFALLGLAGLLFVIGESVRLNRGSGALPWRQWGYFGMSVATYAGLLTVAVALLDGHTRAFYWLVVIDVALLSISALNAWMLLSHARAADDGGAPT